MRTGCGHWPNFEINYQARATILNACLKPFSDRHYIRTQT
ncbi:hypothetical protein HMPREF9370_2155 [Neisseria wadsworthii 9715]|uniref:Uncharacterized protein n=1 Tax=Neisseria wadsworthii 9715 TaxID=1030841 RepID=G4CSS3_9NEIS|nr:hypothetical protein HMPREF9370_2155 [Neisseria wadsworthii 9715]